MDQAQTEIARTSQSGGARFTEIMDGYIYIGDDIEDYQIAVEAAKGASSTARFFLSVDAWDINALVNRKSHAAMLTGTFSCGALSKDPFVVLRGEFQLFSEDSSAPDTDNLVYDFDMISVHLVLTSRLIIRQKEMLSISTVIRSSIRLSPSTLRRHGLPPLPFMPPCHGQMVQPLAGVFSPSAPEISAMSY
jgi:hypothetical protein